MYIYNLKLHSCSILIGNLIRKNLIHVNILIGINSFNSIIYGSHFAHPPAIWPLSSPLKVYILPLKIFAVTVHSIYCGMICTYHLSSQCVTLISMCLLLPVVMQSVTLCCCQYWLQSTKTVPLCQHYWQITFLMVSELYWHVSLY